jgi:hypothetical protein
MAMASIASVEIMVKVASRAVCVQELFMLVFVKAMCTAYK